MYFERIQTCSTDWNLRCICQSWFRNSCSCVTNGSSSFYGAACFRLSSIVRWRLASTMSVKTEEKQSSSIDCKNCCPLAYRRLGVAGGGAVSVSISRSSFSLSASTSSSSSSVSFGLSFFRLFLSKTFSKKLTKEMNELFVHVLKTYRYILFIAHNILSWRLQIEPNR